MVKLLCDKCKKEIGNKYYTINIYGHDTKPQNYTTVCSAHADSTYSSSEDLLRTLNATKMYCKNCVDKIETFINQSE